MEDTIDYYLREGKSKQASRSSYAMTCFQKVIELDPLCVEAFIGLAHVYLNRGDLSSSYHRYTQALVINPNIKDIVLSKGYDDSTELEHMSPVLDGDLLDRILSTATKQRSSNHAIDFYEMALSINNNCLDALIGLAIKYSEIKNYVSAQSYYRRVLAINPKCVGILITAAKSCAAQNEWVEAFKYYDRLIEIVPEYKDEYWNGDRRDRTAKIKSCPGRKWALAKKSQELLDKAKLDEAEKEAGVHLYKAAEYVKNRMGASALSSYEEAFRIDPTCIDALLGQAEIYARSTKSYARSRMNRCYESAIKIDPKSANVFNSRAISYSVMGMTEEAEADYTKAALLQNQTLPEYLSSGNRAEKDKNYLQAIGCYSAAIIKYPNEADGYLARARALTLMGRKARAAGDYEDGCKLKKITPEDHLQEALRLYDEAEYSKAETHLSAAIEKNPSLLDAYVLRAKVHWADRNIEEAVSDYKVYCDSLDIDSGAHIKAGKENLATADTYKSIAHLTAAMEMDPRADEAYMLRYKAYLEVGDDDHAIEDLTQGCLLQHKSTQEHIHSGRMCCKNGEHWMAVGHYSAAIELAPTVVETYIYRARALMEIESQRQRAIDDCHKAIAFNASCKDAYMVMADIGIMELRGTKMPSSRWSYILEMAGIDFRTGFCSTEQNDSYYASCGAEYFKEGEYEKAIFCLSEAIRRKKDIAAYWYQRGDAYLGLSEKLKRHAANDVFLVNAVSDYTHAIQLEPNHARHYVFTRQHLNKAPLGQIDLIKIEEFTRILGAEKIGLVPFRLLPPGQWTIDDIITHYHRYSKALAREYSGQRILPDRLHAIKKLDPEKCFIGEEGWLGYVVFTFRKKDVVIMECPIEGNATYIVASNEWPTAACQTKMNLRGNFRHRRFVHNSDLWFQNVSEALHEGQKGLLKPDGL